ncbi:MAG: ABC transporter ATP-binding protein [Epsilonproteobacteria bacterium]|nr:ABC transporter ATP-binding protein [Campylobacterota bacterium]MBD3839632.1 ABC transporter ATP-binding protein [Campylobacterota bacterium]
MRRLFKDYLPYLKEYKFKFFLSVLGMIAVAIGTAGTAQLIKPVLDDVFINKNEQMLILMPFLLFGAFFLKGAGYYIQTYYMSYIGLDVIKKLRNKLVSHLMYQDIEFFTKMHSGEILSRVTNDISRIQSVVSNIIPNIIREVLTIVALTGYVIYESPKLAFYFLIVMPLVIFPLSKLSKKMKRYSKLSQESTSVMTSRLGEIFSNIEIIKSNSSQDFENKRFEKDNQSVFNYLIKQIKVNALTTPVMEILGSIAIGVVIYVGGMEVISGKLSVGGFFSFSTALFMLYTPIKRVSTIYNQTQDATVAHERMLELLSIKPMVTSGEKILTSKVKTVSFERVGLEYGDIKALNSISMDIKMGESIALVGNSGAGKSSFVNLLVRFYNPSNGVIRLDGVDIREIDLISLHQKIAYVTQRIYIFNDTVANNIAYGENVDKFRVIEALKKANAYDFIEKLTDGIETVLSENGSNLSGGQRQRVALARAIYKNPDILILDEATSALDNVSQRAIQNALKSLKEEMITITIAHRLNTIEDADKIFLFQDGDIVCYGKHGYLLENCEKYQELALNLEKN